MPVTARRYVFAATRGFAPPHEVAGNFSKLERGYWGVLDIFTLSRHRRLKWQLLLVYEMESTDHGTHVDENVGAIIFHGSRYLPPNFKIASMSSSSLSLSILIISDQNSQP